VIVTLDQVPPAVISDKFVVEPAQTTVVPVIGEGVRLTVIE
jgi:hypothetical protein